MGNLVRELMAAALTAGPGRWAAFPALAQHPDPTGTQALVDLSVHRDWTVRRAAVASLGQRASSVEGDAAVLTALQDPSSFVRRAALTAASTLARSDARPQVIAALHDPDPDLREVALGALRGLWTTADFDPVWHLHTHDPVERLRRNAAFLLREHADLPHWPTLFEAWRNDPLPRHREWAIELAEQFGEGSMPALHPLLQDPDGHVRRAARRAEQALAGRTGPPGSEPAPHRP